MDDGMKNSEKIREVASNTRVMSESVLHELDYGDFTFEDLMWFHERLASEASIAYNLCEQALASMREES